MAAAWPRPSRKTGHLRRSRLRGGPLRVGRRETRRRVTGVPSLPAAYTGNFSTTNYTRASRWPRVRRAGFRQASRRPSHQGAIISFANNSHGREQQEKRTQTATPPSAEAQPYSGERPQQGQYRPGGAPAASVRSRAGGRRAARPSTNSSPARKPQARAQRLASSRSGRRPARPFRRPRSWSNRHRDRHGADLHNPRGDGCYSPHRFAQAVSPIWP